MIHNEDTFNHVKGIRIRAISYSMIIIATLLYALLIHQSNHMQKEYDQLAVSTSEYMTCEEYALQLNAASDYLTEQVQLYAVNMEPSYMEAYFEECESKRRENALANLEQMPVAQKAYSCVETAQLLSNELTHTEFYSMKLISVANGYADSTLPEAIRDITLSEEDAALDSDAQIALARDLVFNNDYQDTKKTIEDNMTLFSAIILSSTKEEQQNNSATLDSTITRQYLCITALFVMNIIIFILIILLVIRPLKKYMNCIKNGKLFEIIGAYEFKYLALTYNNMYELYRTKLEQLKHRAEHDSLTNIMNRGAFYEITSQIKGNGQNIALLLFDIDCFKSVNDTYGHDIGDKILQKVAHLLTDNIRSTDFAFRFGGDEFCVIMTDILFQDDKMLLRKVAFINGILQNPTDELPPISLSVGVAFSTNGYDQQLYHNADQALYIVKENGRCGCSISEEVVNE